MMDNKGCDNIDEDEWYAGLGVVPLSSEKTSCSAQAQGSSAVVVDSGMVSEAYGGEREKVLEEGVRGGVVPGVSGLGGGGDVVMHRANLGRDLDQNQRDKSMDASLHMEGFLAVSKQGEPAFSLPSASGAPGLKAGQEAVEFRYANQESTREMAAAAAPAEVEEDDEDEDMGGVILADEVNSRSYTSLPYGKGLPTVQKYIKPASFVRRDRVVFLGSPPELPPRFTPDSVPGGAMTRVGPIVIISNLMWWINDIHVRELAAEFGTIRAVRIVERPKDGRSLGICLIEYVNPDSSPKALQGISASFANKFEGRPLYVVPLPLHGELHIALDNINPHWSRGGIIAEEILAMICQLVGVDIQTAGLEIQPETGTIVGLAQPRFADYASYYFPDGTPSWFPPLYVEALKHLRDLIPPSRLQHYKSSHSGAGEMGTGTGEGGGGSSSRHFLHKTRSSFANQTSGGTGGGASTHYTSADNECEEMDHLVNDFPGGQGGDSRDAIQSYSGGGTKAHYATGDHQQSKGLRKGHDSSSGPGSAESFNGTSQSVDEPYQYNTSSGGGGRGGRGSKSHKYDHGLCEGNSGGGSSSRDTFAPFRDDDDYVSEGGATGSLHGNKKLASQRRDYNRERVERERGERAERERGEREREKDRERAERERGERAERERGEREREKDRERNKERNKDRGREKGDKDKYREKDWEREDNDWERDKVGLYSKGSGGGPSQSSANTKEPNERGGNYSKKSSGGAGNVAGGLEHGGTSAKSSSKKHRSSSESSRSRSPQRRLPSKHAKKDMSKFPSNSSKEKSWEGRGSGSNNNNSSRGSKNSYRDSRSLAERGGWDRRSGRR